MILPIIIEPDKFLHQISEKIEQADLATPRLQKLIASMVETMYAKDGVGFAATQIGQGVRLIVISKEFNPLNKRKELILINPTWEKTSIFKSWDEEGCLSVPFIYGEVKRYRKIKVRAWNEKGQELNFMAEDYEARVIQHEVDHLDGVIFVSKAKNLHEIRKEL
jgi:peptide deformylase